MSDQNKFHCNHKGMHFSDPGFKQICKEQCAACADFAPQDGGYSKEHQNKLTAEKIKLVQTILNMVDPYTMTISNNSAIAAMDAFYNMQTAAKDEEVKNLTEEVKSWKEKALDNEWHRIQKLEERIKELEKQLEIAGTKIGVSNMRIKTFEKATEEKNDLLKVNEARIAELEKDANTMYEKMNGKIQFEKDKNKQLLEKVEQLEKDLENADVLLKGALPHLYNHGLASVRGEANEIRYFLSSRENNKP